MLLKFKSLIYRYTGIYLAYREETAYLKSKAFWEEFTKILNHPENDMRPRDIQGLLIGLWQARHGFARPSSRVWGRKPKHFWRILDWFICLYIEIKWDIKKLFRSFKRSK